MVILNIININIKGTIHLTITSINHYIAHIDDITKLLNYEGIHSLTIQPSFKILSVEEVTLDNSINVKNECNAIPFTIDKYKQACIKQKNLENNSKCKCF